GGAGRGSGARRWPAPEGARGGWPAGRPRRARRASGQLDACSSAWPTTWPGRKSPQRQPHRDQPRRCEQRERGEARGLELFGEGGLVVDELPERFDHLAEQDAEGDGERGGAPGVVGRRPAARDAPGGEGEDRDGEEPVGVPAEAAAVVLVAGEVPVEVDEEAEEDGEGEGEARTERHVMPPFEPPSPGSC